ncbi:MAG TPA: AAA family ATPase [Ferruginibacter sp.]|nr:AAA family ATPase [Ferruginibacter sp.]
MQAHNNGVIDPNHHPKGTEINQSSIEDSLLMAIQNLDTPIDNTGLFKVKTSNQWLLDASSRPVPKALYQSLWFEDEICVLFAETNLGKSILAVQIGVEIAANQKIIYFDFELTDKQFERRYSEDFTNHYTFPENFLRAEIDPEEVEYAIAGFKTMEDYLINSIERVVIETGAKVLIIDNLTYLRTETEKAKDALPLMKQIKALKNKYWLSILCLAHTPKRDLSKSITQNDLAGSKMLMNFCDSSFAIGSSTQDKATRYIKQIKVRNSEFLFDSENVAIYQIEKPFNFVHFSSKGFSSEREHLKQMTEQDRENIIRKVKELSVQGLSQREIAANLYISVGSVNNYLKK